MSDEKGYKGQVVRGGGLVSRNGLDFGVSMRVCLKESLSGQVSFPKTEIASVKPIDKCETTPMFF